MSGWNARSKFQISDHQRQLSNLEINLAKNTNLMGQACPKCLHSGNSSSKNRGMFGTAPKSGADAPDRIDSKSTATQWLSLQLNNSRISQLHNSVNAFPLFELLNQIHIFHKLVLCIGFSLSPPFDDCFFPPVLAYVSTVIFACFILPLFLLVFKLTVLTNLEVWQSSFTYFKSAHFRNFRVCAGQQPMYVLATFSMFFLSSFTCSIGINIIDTKCIHKCTKWQKL